LSGNEVCRRIREQPWGTDMTVLALTGWGQEHDRQKSSDAGFDGHLVKPIEYSALIERLESLQRAKAGA
jgi:DNA-binding response OmpR family regulator